MGYESRWFELGSQAGDVLAGRDGWLYWRLPAIDVDVRVHVVDGRSGYFIEAVVVRSTTLGAAVTGTDMRAVPLGRLSSALGQLELIDLITAASSAPAAPLLDPVNCSPADAVLIAAGIPSPERRHPELWLFDEDRRRYDPMMFNLVLLDRFEKAARHSARPAADIATANGLPVTKVHQWLKEARRWKREFDKHRQQGPAPSERDARLG